MKTGGAISGLVVLLLQDLEMGLVVDGSDEEVNANTICRPVRQRRQQLRQTAIFIFYKFCPSDCSAGFWIDVCCRDDMMSNEGSSA